MRIKSKFDYNGLNRILSDERGVFAPLFAVVALGLFFILVILGIDTGRIKVAQSELRTKVDQICGELAWSPSSYTLNLRRFRDYLQQQVDQDVLEYGKIEKAKLTMPTMPASGGFNFKAGQNYLLSDGAPTIDNIQSPNPISDYGVASCSFESGENCKFQGTILGDTNVPFPMQDNLIMSGNMVMCEVSVRVGTFLLGRFLDDDEELVTVKSAFWTPLRGVNPIYNPANPTNTSPGLTIAIATQLNTSAWDGRFRFSSTGGASVDTDFRNRYDPFYTVNRPSPAHLPFSAPTTRVFPFDDSAGDSPSLQSIAAIDNLNFMGSIPAAATEAQPSNQMDAEPSSQFYSIPFTATASDKVSDREAILTACMNPLVLVRNTFVSTIIELASRHGQLRNMTEVLHVNPMHRAKDMSFGGDNYIPNQPALITSFGQDIAQPNYQIPYVFFNSGSDSAEYPEPSSGWPASQLGINTYSKGGWINPFTNGGNPGSGWVANTNIPLASHHALVASQLRMCYHLYSGGYNSAVSPTNVGVQRYGKFLDFLANPGFYPTAIRGVYPAADSNERWPDQIRQMNYQTGQYWDQCSPWGVADSGCTGANQNQSRNLTAAEVTSILGTTQLCPYNQVDTNIFGTVSVDPGWAIPGNVVNACPPAEVKNATSDPYTGDTTVTSYELRPDVGAVLRYALGTSNGGGAMPPPTAEDQVDAISPPGLFPIIDNGLVERPFLGVNTKLGGIDPYQTTRNELSTILIVLHQPPTREQIDDLKEVFEEYYRPQWQISADDRRVGRPIIIAYFPANEADSNAVGVFDEIFAGAGDSMNVPNSATSPVTVLNFSPYDDVWGKPPCGLVADPDVGPVIPSGATEAEVFRNYWQCMLVDSEAGIVAQAQRVFRERITRRETKL